MHVLGESYKKYPYLAGYLKNARDIKPETMDFLVRNGADVNMPDESLCYPLHIAIARDRLDAVMCLEKAGADISVQSPLAELVPRSVYYKDSNLEIAAYALADCGQLAVFSGDAGIFDHYRETIDPETQVALSGYFGYQTTIPLIEIPLVMKRNSYSLGDILIFRKMWADYTAKCGVAPSLSSKYDDVFLGAVLDDLDLLRKGLLTTKNDAASYIPWAIVSGSRVASDLLLDYCGLKYSDKIKMVAMTFTDCTVGTGYDWYESREEEMKIPVYAYALLAGNREMLDYIKDKGGDLTIPFTIRKFDANEDRYYQEEISGE